MSWCQFKNEPNAVYRDIYLFNSCLINWYSTENLSVFKAFLMIVYRNSGLLYVWFNDLWTILFCVYNVNYSGTRIFHWHSFVICWFWHMVVSIRILIHEWMNDILLLRNTNRLKNSEGWIWLPIPGNSNPQWAETRRCWVQGQTGLHFKSLFSKTIQQPSTQPNIQPVK